MSYTNTVSKTFTVTHARYLASKVATDMALCSRYYDHPKSTSIADYEAELTALIRDGYFKCLQFGFSRNDVPILAWLYEVDENGVVTCDDSPGKISTGIDVTNTTFFNWLEYSEKFFRLTEEQQEKYLLALPIQRTLQDRPGEGVGVWVSDKNYHSGGVSVSRKKFRSY